MTGTRIFSVDQLLDVLDQVVGASARGDRAHASAAGYWSGLLTTPGHPLATQLPDEPLLDWQERGLLGDLDGARVLDVGCGAGRNTRWFAEQGATVDGIDLAKDLLDQQRPSMPSTVTLTALDVLRDPLPNPAHDHAHAHEHHRAHDSAYDHAHDHAYDSRHDSEHDHAYDSRHDSEHGRAYDSRHDSEHGRAHDHEHEHDSGHDHAYDRESDRGYDVVYDSGCFHHIAPHRRITYLQRVLPLVRPGGRFGIVTFAAERMEAPSDLDIVTTGDTAGGMTFSLDDLRTIFAPLTPLDVRPVDTHRPNTFAPDFLNTALFTTT